MMVYLCGGTFEEILCGIYEAWTNHGGENQVRLALNRQEFQPSLFEEYRVVPYDEEKFQRTYDMIKNSLSLQILDWVYRASLSQDGERADKIYRFLAEAFRRGPKAADQIQLQAVHDVFQLCRSVGNESHRIMEFLRFDQGPSGLLISRIAPKNDVLPLISGYFSDRLLEEDWLIWDVNRKKASVHPGGRNWYLVHLRDEEDRQLREMTRREKSDSQREDFGQLWKIFCESIAISQRKNPRCQMNHLPLRYRPYMTEFLP